MQFYVSSSHARSSQDESDGDDGDIYVPVKERQKALLEKQVGLFLSQLLRLLHNITSLSLCASQAVKRRQVTLEEIRRREDEERKRNAERPTVGPKAVVT